MASILVKTSGIEITNVTVYVPDPPLAPPQPTQPTQIPDPSSGSSSSSSTSSSGGGGTTYTPEYYQGYVETILSALYAGSGSAGVVTFGNGYSGQFYNNSTSTSDNYQEGGGGGSTSSSSASSSTSNSQQSSSNSSASSSTDSTNSTGSTGSGFYAPQGPTESSPVETVVGARPQLADTMTYIIDTMRAESSFSTWEISYLSGALYYTAWILCTAMHGEPVLLWASVKSIDGSDKTCAGIVTPEYLIKKFSGNVLIGTSTGLSRSRIESICNEGWNLWLDWYAANKATNTGIEWLYNTTQLKVMSTNDKVNELNLSFRDAESGMSFPAKIIDDAILTGQSSVIERSILPPDIQALANNYTVIL